MNRRNTHQGFALVTVLILGTVLAALLAAYFTTTLIDLSTTRAAGSSVTGFYAAEAGLNMRAEEIRKKFQDYRRPTANDLTEKDYALSSGRTVTTFGTEAAVGAGDAYTIINAPDDAFNGLASLNSVYTISSVAKNTAGDTEAQLDMQITMREIPVFQFLAFHQENMEFHPGPAMTVNGRVHSNKTVYLAANSGLSIDGLVSGVTGIEHGYTAGCGSGQVRVMGSDGSFKNFGSAGTCHRMSENDLRAFGGRVKYLAEPLALPSPESFEWRGGGGFYWSRADLRMVLVQDSYVDLFEAAGRGGDRPIFIVPGNVNGCGNGNGNANGCGNGNGNGNANGCGNGNGNANGCGQSIPVPILAPEILVYNSVGNVDMAATRKLYRLMIDNPGMVTVNLPRSGRNNNGRPNAGSADSPANQGGNKFLTTSYAALNNIPLIPPYCQTYRNEPRPWTTSDANQHVRSKGYTYPNGWSIDAPQTPFSPQDVYAYFTNPGNPSNLTNICKHVVARGEFYHYRQNREMLMLNINLRQFLQANKDAPSAARLFDPTVAGLNGGLVLYFSVDGPNHTPAAGRGNNYGVRLFDGADLSMTQGVTFVTDQAAYVQGDFNCRALATAADLAALPRNTSDTGNLDGSGNPVSELQPRPRRCHQVVSDSGSALRDDQIQDSGLKRGVAVIADSVNILSDAWKDENSRSALDGRRPSMTQQNLAILAGSSRDGEGGLHNFPRFLEDWGYVDGAVRYRYRGSLVAFRFPRRVDGAFVRNVSPSINSCCGLNYKPPIRDWDFDLDFRDARRLPPLTPRAVSIKQDLFLREFERP